QAEDGIRDFHVTGVQTCALPILMGTAQDAKSQLKLPSASSKQSLTQELGIGTIELNYQRPSARGREIFGQLVPYGEVWRTGANDATAITFSTDEIGRAHV